MDKQTTYMQHIHQACPNLVIETVRLHTGDGQFNDLLIVNEALIFRFPRYLHGVKQLAAETAILHRLQGYLPLPIPDPFYQNLASQTVGQVFMGYRLIPGQPLWPETLLSIEDEDTLQSLATQLATFLRTLHSLPVEALGLDLPVFDGPDEWADMYARFRARLFPFMRPEACAWVSDHFETFLNDARNFDYTPVLRHGDFGSSNILFDPKRQAISGVIDFSGAGLGDAAVDFAAILCPASYGEQFLQRFYPLYPEIEPMLARARFYAGTFALQEALYGIEDGDPEAFERGIAQYR